MNNIKGTRQINSVTTEDRVFKKIFKNCRKGSGDCLVKTQDVAKFKDKVLCLSPAKC